MYSDPGMCPALSAVLPACGSHQSPFRRSVGWLVALAGLATSTCAASTPNAPVRPESGLSDLFSPGAVHVIRLAVHPADLDSLRRNPRSVVPASVRFGGELYEKVHLHLKGSTGSFRGVDAQPSLSLTFRRDAPCHGLRRMHLNNSAEDPSLLNEQLGGELFRAAGVPAPRVAHARVDLNARPLGLYVLKEGFAEEFLEAQFGRSDGAVYEPDLGSDVDGSMRRHVGHGLPTGQADLRGLANAAAEPELERRWQRLEEVLDTDRFLTFMALEVMLGHRDGYCLARNNFRLYGDPGSGKFVFLPHGMDQLLGKADLPWKPHLAGLVARAVIETPEGRQRYRARFGMLFERWFQVPQLCQRVDDAVDALRPALSRREFASLAQAAALTKERLALRAAALQAQLAEPELTPLAFAERSADLAGWTAVDALSAAAMDRVRSPDGVDALHVRAGPRTAASWRTRVLLLRGRYRFEGRAKLSAVRPLPVGTAHGAGLRVVGRRRPGNNLLGDSAWRALATEFQVDAVAEEVELVCEVCASGGEVWFDTASLRLLKLP